MRRPRRGVAPPARPWQRDDPFAWGSSTWRVPVPQKQSAIRADFQKPLPQCISLRAPDLQRENISLRQEKRLFACIHSMLCRFGIKRSDLCPVARCIGRKQGVIQRLAGHASSARRPATHV